MEPVPLCRGEVILTMERPQQMMSVDWKSCRAAAVVVPDAVSVETAKSCVGDRMVGMLINADGWNADKDIGEKWPSERLIGRFRNMARRALHEEADFVYIRMKQNLHVLRAAVLAATELDGLGVFVEMPVDEDARTADDSSAMAVMGILQRIGVAGIVLTGEPMDIDDTIDELAPHANIALGVSGDPGELRYMRELANVEFYNASEPDDVRRLLELTPPCVRRNKRDADDDYILAPVGMHAHFVDATIDISDAVDLEDRFGETLLELEDQWSGALKLEINTPEDVHLLAEGQYMLDRPVCLAAENPKLLEKALCAFDGIALYDGTCELDDETIDYFQHHYGMVVL